MYNSLQYRNVYVGTHMKRILFASLLSFGLFMFVSTPPVRAVDVLLDPCVQVPDAVACQDRNQTPESNSLYGTDGVITKITRLVAVIVGIAAVIVVIIGGLSYVLSSGDPNRVNSAKNMILYAIIGLIVALMAQVIVVYVLTKL